MSGVPVEPKFCSPSERGIIFYLGYLLTPACQKSVCVPDQEVSRGRGRPEAARCGDQLPGMHPGIEGHDMRCLFIVSGSCARAHATGTGFPRNLETSLNYCETHSIRKVSPILKQSNYPMTPLWLLSGE